MYGEPSGVPLLDWAWVDAELTAAGTYWVTPGGGARPHPRPVWGVWLDGLLHLSIGSPVLARLLERNVDLAVHLDSGVDVVIIEATVAGFTGNASVLHTYNEKYDWNYTVEEYGRLTSVAPASVLAWRSAGWAGRDGFQQTGRFRFPPPTGAP